MSAAVAAGPPPSPLLRVPAALKVLRSFRRLSLQELAAAAGLPLRRVARYQRGEGSPTLEELERLLAALGCPPPLFWDLLCWLERNCLPGPRPEEAVAERGAARPHPCG